MIILFKYYADVGNYESFRGFGFIYILVSCSCDARLNKRIIYKFKKYFFYII